MGPLTGVRVIELKGIGPGPYAGMLLADLGADVVVVERVAPDSGIAPPAAQDVHGRGKRSIALDLKAADGVNALLRLVERADMLLEGYRPGVAERLGCGPDACFARNGALVYGRVTGWGQHGPLSGAAGHDINYIALSGALAAIGEQGRPVPPLNLLGDYAGGSLFLVIGMLAALLTARTSGAGQVVDAAITDGAASLMSVVHGLAALGHWQAQRAGNLLDGGAPHYGVYETGDGRFLAVGALEPQFRARLLELCELDAAALGDFDERRLWPAQKAQLAAVFRTRTQSEWCDLFAGTDACVAPVLDYTEAPTHPHHRARGSYVDIGGVAQAAPAPRFSRSTCDLPAAPRAAGADTDAVLAEAGFSRADIAALRRGGAVA